jgi:hypothetical protein
VADDDNTVRTGAPSGKGGSDIRPVSITEEMKLSRLRHERDRVARFA